MTSHDYVGAVDWCRGIGKYELAREAGGRSAVDRLELAVKNDLIELLHHTRRLGTPRVRIQEEVEIASDRQAEAPVVKGMFSPGLLPREIHTHKNRE